MKKTAGAGKGGRRAVRDVCKKKGISVRILGDFEPFSKMGKSIGYQVSIQGTSFLIDCGAPLFQQMGSKGIAEIKGVIITHCHDDHKRWFTDLLLYKMYRSHISPKVSLFTSEDVLGEILTASGPSLNRSLSHDSERVIDIPFGSYSNVNLLGPRARYRIVASDDGEGRTRVAVVDRRGSALGPESAKIVIHPATRRQRLLLKDPEYGEWVEPESFYTFSSDIFYEREKNVYHDEAGFTITALKAPVWHGIPGFGLVFRTREERLVFSSDTVHDPALWKKLSEKKRRSSVRKKGFEEAAVIYGDINDYVERAWSRERYEEAMAAFHEGVVIHDVASKNSVVHTDYEKLHRTSLAKNRTILTHSPDTITSEWVLCDSEKVFFVSGDKFYEVVDGSLFEMNADIYHREVGHYFIGYRNESGRYTVYERDGLLGIAKDGVPPKSREMYRVDLFEDIGGRYYPKLEDGRMTYRCRKDGKVELVTMKRDGSSGQIIQSVRTRRPR